MATVNFDRRSTQTELMDSDSVDFAEFNECLRQLTIVNIFTLAYRPTLYWLKRMLDKAPPVEATSILDVGSGAGDMLRRIWKSLKRHDLNADLTGVDLNPWSKRSAEEVTPSQLKIRFETSNIFSFDETRHCGPPHEAGATSVQPPKGHLSGRTPGINTPAERALFP
jgi:hypothetical protein